MGNSPSRDDNDPLPKSSTNSSSSTSGGSTGNTDLESDEKTRPPLSQSNHRPKRLTTTNESGKESNHNVSTYSTSPAINIGNVTNQKSIKQSHNYLELPKKQNRKQGLPGSPNSDYDLDLEIGMSMAMLLKSQQDEDSYGPSSFSSDESKSSSTLCSSGNKDEDTSVSSLNSSPSLANKFYLKEESKETVSLNKLDAIAEMNSLESTPEPRRGVSSSVNGSESIGLSHENLKKHSKAGSTRQLTKNVSSSSSSVSNSPPMVHTSRKLEIDIDEIIDRLLRIGIKKSSSKKDKLPVVEHEIKYILSKSRSIFLEQPTLLRLSPPVKVVGDVHGQFHDLIRIFNCCGYPPYSNYLFLGDYVDRGYKSLETILLLLCYKIKYPENFFMLRGNHESANITKIYGFYDECKRRLTNRKLWKNFIDVFNTLPIAATINDKIFCVHGGLSPDLQDLKNIEQIKRPTDVPDRGLLADLLWSDPDPSIKNFSLTWPKNDRGVSYCFGRKHVDYFCQQFRMDLVVRGHMVVEDGYEFFNKRRLVTIFSAPNYCGEFNNFGAIMSVDKNLYCSFELIKPN